MSRSSKARTRIALSLWQSRSSGRPVRSPQVPCTDGPQGHRPDADRAAQDAPTAPDPPSGRTGPRDMWDMAGQAQRGSRGHGRSSRPGSSLPRAEAATAAGRGVASAPTSPKRKAPGGRRRQAPATRPVYRLLLMKGLTPTEAANLTAYICGLPTSDLALVAQAGQPAAVPARDAPGRPLRRHRRREEHGRTDPRFQPDSGGTLLPRRDRPPEAAPSLLPAPLRSACTGA